MNRPPTSPASPSHYLLVKREGFAVNGSSMTADASARALLDQGLWPLWIGTRNRLAMRTGDTVGVYLAGVGNQTVLATARIAGVTPWTSRDHRRYPLMLDGTPVAVLELVDVKYMPAPVSVRPRLAHMSIFASGVPLKWGAAFMGGARALSRQDFQVLFAS